MHDDRLYSHCPCSAAGSQLIAFLPPYALRMTNEQHAIELDPQAVMHDGTSDPEPVMHVDLSGMPGQP